MSIGYVAHEEGDLDLGDDEQPKRSKIRKAAGLPTWLHLAPAGPEVQGRDGRAFAVINPALVVERTQPELPMLVDWDHESMFGLSTKAALWIDQVVFVAEAEVSPTTPAPGFWGHVERWTPEGESDVRNFRFRNLSPVIRHQIREPESEGDEAPPPVLLSFENVALTNRPNLRMVSLNSESAPSAEGAAAMSEEELAELRSLLGLEEDADGAAILAAVAAALMPDEEPEEPPADEEAAEAARQLDAVNAANRVLTADLAASRAALAEHTAAAAQADVDSQTALVDTAITEGRAHATMRDDLVRLATSERPEDRDMFGRLTAAKIAGAPRGRVTHSGEARPAAGGRRRTTIGRKAEINALSEADQHTYRAMKSAGFGHSDILDKIEERKAV